MFATATARTPGRLHGPRLYHPGRSLPWSSPHRFERAHACSAARGSPQGVITRKAPNGPRRSSCAATPSLLITPPMPPRLPCLSPLPCAHAFPAYHPSHAGTPSLLITPPMRARLPCLSPLRMQPRLGTGLPWLSPVPGQCGPFPGCHPSHRPTPSVVIPPGSRALLEQQSPAQVRVRLGLGLGIGMGIGIGIEIGIGIGIGLGIGIEP